MELYQFAVLAVVVGYFVFLMWLVITSKQVSPGPWLYWGDA